MPWRAGRVACDTLVRDDGTTFAVLASHAAEPLTVTPALAAEQTLDRVTMAPFGINIVTINGSGPAASAGLTGVPSGPSTVDSPRVRVPWPGGGHPQLLHAGTGPGPPSPDGRHPGWPGTVNPCPAGPVTGDG